MFKERGETARMHGLFRDFALHMQHNYKSNLGQSQVKLTIQAKITASILTFNSPQYISLTTSTDESQANDCEAFSGHARVFLKQSRITSKPFSPTKIT